jgi:O-antigen/teichoic acid export membrane protein
VDSSQVNAGDEVRRSGSAVTLYRGSAVFLAIYLIGSGISFAVHLFAARSLGATSYGYFVYATTWMAILLLGCSIGLRPTMIRFAAAYKARGEWGMLRGLTRSATAWTITASLVVASASAIAIWLLQPRPDELRETLLLIVLATPFMALSDVWSSGVRGLGSVATSQVPASIVQHTLFGIALIVIFHASGTERGASSAAGAFLVATIGTFGVAGWLLRRALPSEVGASQPNFHRREWLGVAGGNALISVFQAARAPLVVVISGFYVDPQHIAFYVAGQRLANVASLAPFGISGFASPLISQYFALSDRTRLQRLAHLAARGALGGSMLIALVLFVFGRELLRLFGDGFDAAYMPLLVLLIGELVAAATGPVGNFLSMTGRQMNATRIEGAVSAAAIFLALVLIPRYGILGTAIVVAACSCLRNIAMFIAVWRHLGLRSAAF